MRCLSLLLGICLTAATASAQDGTPAPPPLEDEQVQDAIADFERFKKLAAAAYRVKVNDKRQSLVRVLRDEMARIRQTGSLDDAIRLRDYIAAQERLTIKDEPNPKDPQPRRQVGRKWRLPSDGYFRFKGSKYLLSPKAMPWWRADEVARELGGHILRIDSPEEFNAVRTKYCRPQEYLWLDRRLYEDGTWYHSDGTRAATLPWASDGHKGGNHRHCTISTNGVHDAMGDHQWHFVLEIEDDT